MNQTNIFEIEYCQIPEITPSKCKELILKKQNIGLEYIESLQLKKFHLQCQLLNKSKQPLYTEEQAKQWRTENIDEYDTDELDDDEKKVRYPDGKSTKGN